MIVKTPDICFGRARIEGERIPVWLLAMLWDAQWDDRKILLNYPQLKQAQLDEARAYRAANTHEIEDDVRHQFNGL